MILSKKIKDRALQKDNQNVNPAEVICEVLERINRCLNDCHSVLEKIAKAVEKKEK